MKIEEILSKCDHTLLAQTATWEEIKAICDDGIKYHTASVCIPASYVKQAKNYVGGLLPICTVIVCLALAHVALQVGDRGLAALLVCTAAATGGFLVWNYPRGMLFAGDGGAYIWGVVIAMASISLVQRNADVSPWFPLLLLIYPVWETLFSIYRKTVRGVSPGVADALHFHQLIYRRIVRSVFHDDESRRVLMRNNRTSPYLWGFTLLTVVPAVLFWNNTPLLMAFCGLFVISYVMAYMAIVRFKVPEWLRR